MSTLNNKILKSFCKGCKGELKEGEKTFHSGCLESLKEYFEENKWGMFLRSVYGRITLHFLVADIIIYGEEEVLLDNVNNPEIIGLIKYAKEKNIYKLENGSLQMNFFGYFGNIGESEFENQEDDD